jgi:uncharacterized protein (DUF1778 family)
MMTMEIFKAPRKTSYIHARISRSDHTLAELAADHAGQSLSEFVVSAVRQRTRQTIGQALLELTPEQRALMMQELGPIGEDIMQEMHERYTAKLRELAEEFSAK